MAWYRRGYDSYNYGGWAPYVPVAVRRAQALKKMAALQKKGVNIQPVKIEGRKITKNFWGESWCEHLESFSDFENRLPRGRAYVRNGSVCHLEMAKGNIKAKVSGSELYDVKVEIKTLPKERWKSLKQRCGGRIGSLLELLQGKLSDHVMEVVTHREEGLFPLPGEMSFSCSCPDWAYMCKHVAAVLYGVGARLDDQPELLFALRGVDHEELIAADAETALTAATAQGQSKRLADEELGQVFGIELNLGTENTPATATPDAKKIAAAMKQTASKIIESATNKKQISAKTKKTSPGKKQAAAKTKKTSPGKKQAAAKTKRTSPGKKQAAAKTKKTSPGTKQTAAKTKKTVFSSEQAASKNNKSVIRIDQAVSKTKKAAAGTKQALSKIKKSAAGKKQTISKTKKAAISLKSSLS